MTQTQGYMTGTKGMGRHKVTNSQSKPKKLYNNIKHFPTIPNLVITNHIHQISSLINPKSCSSHAFNTNHNHKSFQYIKHVNTHDTTTTAVSRDNSLTYMPT